MMTVASSRHSTVQRRFLAVAIVAALMLAFQFRGQPSALAAPLGHEAQLVVDRLLAPP